MSLIPLIQDHKAKRLYGCYIINTNDIDSALAELSIVLSNILESEQLNSADNAHNIFKHPDVRIIELLSKSTRDIAVKQILELQRFIAKTSIVSDHKIAIIREADLMNENSSNACLKMLEEAPSSCLIFLVTKNKDALLPTVLSRCKIINCKYESGECEREDTNDIDVKLLQLYIPTISITEKYGLISEISSNKDRHIFHHFASISLNLLRNIMLMKTNSMRHNNLSDIEQNIISNFEKLNIKQIESKYDKIVAIVKKTSDFDLDLKASSILLLEEFLSIS